MDDKILKEAFSALDNHQAVIGPAADGGYYLIGFSHPAPCLNNIFENKPWSTSSVFSLTMTALKKLGLSVYVLPVLTDVDTVEDIESCQLPDFG